MLWRRVPPLLSSPPPPSVSLLDGRKRRLDGFVGDSPHLCQFPPISIPNGSCRRRCLPGCLAAAFRLFLATDSHSRTNKSARSCHNDNNMTMIHAAAHRPIIGPSSHLAVLAQASHPSRAVVCGSVSSPLAASFVMHRVLEEQQERRKKGKKEGKKEGRKERKARR
jgi:hypothetical protein